MMKAFFVAAVQVLACFVATEGAKCCGWNQVGRDIDGEAKSDLSGYSVALNADGFILAVGAIENNGNGKASGHVRVFEYNGTEYTQRGLDIDGEAKYDRSGSAVALSSDGSILAVSAMYNDGNSKRSGHVRLFEYNGTNYNQIGSDIDGEAKKDESGTSLSLSSSGKVLAIGSQKNDGGGNKAGHVRVFEYNGTDFVQRGVDHDGEAKGDISGSSVSLSDDGSVLAIGASKNDDGGKDAGHVRVYKYNGTVYEIVGRDINGESTGDNSGFSLSLNSDGSILAVGAPMNNGNGSNSGHVRIYSFNGTEYVQRGPDIEGEEQGDESGHAVSLSGDGNIVAIGAPLNDGNDSKKSGHVRVYSFDGTGYYQLGQDIDGEESGDRSGSAISLSSDGYTLAVGANQNGGNGKESGHVRVFFFPQSERKPVSSSDNNAMMASAIGIVAGGILVAAAVLLISRKRMRSTKRNRSKEVAKVDTISPAAVEHEV